MASLVSTGRSLRSSCGAVQKLERGAGLRGESCTARLQRLHTGLQGFLRNLLKNNTEKSIFLPGAFLIL